MQIAKNSGKRNRNFQIRIGEFFGGRKNISKPVPGNGFLGAVLLPAPEKGILTAKTSNEFGTRL